MTLRVADSDADYSPKSGDDVVDAVPVPVFEHKRDGRRRRHLTDATRVAGELAQPKPEKRGRLTGHLTDATATVSQKVVAHPLEAPAHARHRDHRLRTAIGGGSLPCGSGAGWAAAVDNVDGCAAG